MKNKAVKALLDMNIPMNEVGFEYIADVIDVMSQNPNMAVSHCMELVAGKYQTSYIGIYQGILRAIRIAFTKGNIEILAFWFPINSRVEGILKHFYNKLKEDNLSEIDN